MEKKQIGRKWFGFLRVIIAAFLITGALLLLLAFILYKWEVSETLMTAGTLVIYILSCFVAGLLVGKSGRKRAFLWGALAGTVYYLILLGISLLVTEPEKASAMTILINLAICTASGMTGGMVFRK